MLYNMNTEMNTEPNTLNREIARLYQLGKTTAAVYECSTTAQSLMNLHLELKYNLKNPCNIDVIEEYKRYGRIATRYVPWMKPPIHGLWHLETHIDKSLKIVRHNADETVNAYTANIEYMAFNNPGKKIVIEFNSQLHTQSPDTVLGHSEMIVFDQPSNTIEYIDTNNLPKQSRRKNKDYIVWAEFRLETVRRIVTGLSTKPRLVTNASVYGGYECGIQTLEAGSDLLTVKEQDGYCLMWSHLFADLVMQFTEHTIGEVIRAIMKKATSKNVNVNFVNDYMVYLIRGYMTDITNMYGVSFTSEESMLRGCCRIAMKI